ncbi:MAG: hypothetical protein AAF078_04885 [Planctomycetota bacterium]
MTRGDGWLPLGLGVVVAVVLHVAAAPLVAMRVLDRSWEALGAAMPAVEVAEIAERAVEPVAVEVEVERRSADASDGGAWDLAVTAIDGPGEATIGRAWSWRATVGNVGDGAWSGTVVERAWLSVDDAVDADDVPLVEGRRALALEPGEGLRGSAMVGPGWAEAWAHGEGEAYLIVEAQPIAAAGEGGAAVDPRPANNHRAVRVVVRPAPAAPRFGADDAEPLTTVAWIAYDDFRTLVAPRSPTIQPAIQSRATPVPDAPPIADATDPPPSMPAPASEPARPARVTPPSPPSDDSRAELPAPAPRRTPLDRPDAAAAPTDTPQLARTAAPAPRPAPPAPGVVTPARPGDLSSADAVDTPTTTSRRPVLDADAPDRADEAEARADALDVDALTEVRASDPRDVPDAADGLAMEGVDDADREDDSRVDAATAAPVDRLTGEMDPAARDQSELGPLDTNTSESDEAARRSTDAAADRPDAAQPSAASEPSADRPTMQPATDEPPRPTSAPRQDREAPPTQLRRIDLETPVRPGRVITGPGLEIKTAVPRISGIARFSTLPYGNPRYAITFDTDGVVIAVDPVRPAGPPNWEAPILNSLYEWRASGSRLDTQEQPFTITLTLNLFGREPEEDEEQEASADEGADAGE